jgi:hypothetical protein
MDPGGAAFEALLSRRGGDVLLVVDGGLRIARAGPGAADLAERPLAALPGMSLIAAFGSAALDAIAREAAATGGFTTSRRCGAWSASDAISSGTSVTSCGRR